MNKVCLVGRLTDKPMLIYSQSNKAVARFTIAVNRSYKKDGQAEADFIKCVVFDKQAENVANYLDKGSLISVEGRIQTGSYTDKDGIKKYTTDVMVNSIQFLITNKNSESAVKTEGSAVKSAEEDPFASFGQEIEDDYLE